MTARRILGLLAGLAATAGAQQRVPIAPTGAEPTTRLIRPSILLTVPDSLRPLSRDISVARAVAWMQARRSWAATNLNPCVPVPLKDTTGWTLRSTKAFPVGPSDPTLPAEFVADTGFRGAHGGLRWQSATAAFTLEFGNWGDGIDESDGRAISCLITTRSGTYVVSERVEPDGYSFSAVPAGSIARNTRVVGHARTEDELRIPWTALILLYPPW